jgi:hypothetical protein
MSFKKATLAAAVAATFVGGLAVVDTASAGTVAAGTYDLVILTTPVNSVTLTSNSGATSISTSFNTGSQGNWNSSFTFGGALPGSTSQGMTDNGATSNGVGSGIAADGFAGIIGVNISSGGVMTFTGGAIAGGPMTGLIDLTTGAMTFTPSGRLGTVSSFPALIDEAWNIDNADPCTTTGCNNDGNTVYSSFTTGSAVTLSGGTANGKVFSATADQNADGITDYLGVLVSAGNVGTAFGGFFGAEYLEAWRVRLLSTTVANQHSGFNVDTVFGTAGGDFAQYTKPAVVPVPAAVWLFGSGLLGLVGIARRKAK